MAPTCGLCFIFHFQTSYQNSDSWQSTITDSVVFCIMAALVLRAACTHFTSVFTSAVNRISWLGLFWAIVLELCIKAGWKIEIKYNQQDSSIKAWNVHYATFRDSQHGGRHPNGIFVSVYMNFVDKICEHFMNAVHDFCDGKHNSFCQASVMTKMQ